MKGVLCEIGLLLQAKESR